jgi:hypothetical protein
MYVNVQSAAHQTIHYTFFLLKINPQSSTKSVTLIGC